MKLVSFEVGGKARYGIVVGDEVHTATDRFRRRYADLRAVIAAGATQQLENHLADAGQALESVRFLPPVPNPEKILCIGVNYRPHIAEMGRDIPDHPVVFVRFPGSIVGHNAPLLRPRVSLQFDFEGELAVVIGRRARHVRRERALDVVVGYTCFMDGSVRDWQRHTMQFTAGKNFESSGAMGPWIRTRDHIPDPTKLGLTTRLNGETMQRGRLSELVFDIPGLIEYCSTFTELAPGDIIATGTPGGVGAARTPPVWLREGDRVEVDVDAVGVLANPVWDETPTVAP